MKSPGKVRGDLGGTFFRVPEGQRTDLDFEKRLNRSFHSLSRVPPLPLSKGMRRKFITRRNAVISFEQWLTEAVDRAKPTLNDLHCRHGVPPEAVLGDLIWAKVREATMFSAETRDELTRKLRSLKAREEDAEILEKAAELARWWRPFLDVNAPSREFAPAYNDVNYTWDCCAHLEKLAERLRRIKPQRHRTKEKYLRLVALMLARKLKQITGKPLHEYNYELLRAFFPEKQGPVSDPRKTVKSLLRNAPTI